MADDAGVGENRPTKTKQNTPSFHQLRRFHHVINLDKIVGTHRLPSRRSAPACWIGSTIAFGDVVGKPQTRCGPGTGLDASTLG
jgi:hypothetical protein